MITKTCVICGKDGVYIVGHRRTYCPTHTRTEIRMHRDRAERLSLTPEKLSIIREILGVDRE